MWIANGTRKTPRHYEHRRSLTLSTLLKTMTERTAKSLDEMSMAELWSVAKLLGVSKDCKRDELVARIKQAQDQEGSDGSTPTQAQQPKTTKSTATKEVVYISRYYELRLV